jgi:hypothetical protein
MTHTTLSQEAAATKSVAAGLRKAGPLIHRAIHTASRRLTFNTTRRSASV